MSHFNNNNQNTGVKKLLGIKDLANKMVKDRDVTKLQSLLLAKMGK